MQRRDYALCRRATPSLRWHRHALTQCGRFTIGALTPLFIEIKNKTTGRKELLSNVLGSWAPDVKSPDGFIMETWDFKFNPPVTETPGP